MKSAENMIHTEKRFPIVISFSLSIAPQGNALKIFLSDLWLETKIG